MIRKNKNSGVSLIIAVIFVSAFMLVLAGLAETQIKTIQALANREASGKVLYLSQSVAEAANYWRATHNVGQNVKSDSAAGMENPINLLVSAANDIGISDPDVGFEITGHAAEQIKAPDEKKYYSAPSAGTGNAAEKCADPVNADDPCHWSKLKLAKAVEIPLYYTDDNGDTKKLGVGDKLHVRVRSPCGEFKADSAGQYKCSENVELYPNSSMKSAYKHIEKDPTLIHWQIQEEGSDKVLMANGGMDSNKEKENNKAVLRPDPDTIENSLLNPEKEKNKQVNTELYAGRINAAKEYGGGLNFFTVLEETFAGKSFTKNKDEYKKIIDFIANFNKPILRLNLVTRPRKLPADYLLNKNIDWEDASLFLPYLEYQILSDKPISDSKTTIFSWAQNGPFRKEFTKYIDRPAKAGGFVLGNL